MLDALARLDSTILRDLAAGLRSGRLSWPSPPSVSLASFLSSESVSAVKESLELLGRDGFSAAQAGLLVEAIATAHSAKPSSILDLVWTGPDMPLLEGRSTLPVVNELFQQARKRVLITGYALYDGKQIFKTLVQQLNSFPGIEVMLVLNIARKSADTSIDALVVARWAKDFLRQHWKCNSLPKVFYDPRSLRGKGKGKDGAVMHAKCIVVDGTVSFIGSANLTEAAQRRNIEAGILSHDPAIARKVEEKFHSLIQGGYLLQVNF
jgi:phosphatidylserine/phosphatidylglycerophosphate/cardiolipin synthase-like enzyme